LTFYENELVRKYGITYDGGNPVPCDDKAAANFNAAMTVLKPEIDAQKRKVEKLGKVLIGTVKGDVHSIGKDIVATVLDTSGFDVVDMGVDNPSLHIIQEAEKLQVDVIALSSFL